MRYFLEVSYDGTAFHGSQLQGKIATVQLAINQACSMLLRTDIVTFGASRTDEGVHALGNFYHFDFDDALPLHFQYKLNAVLPKTIAIVNIYKTLDPQLNARFAALSRRYRYKIYSKKNPFKIEKALFHPYPLDLNILNQTAAELNNHIDFESFSKRNNQSYTYNCTIFKSYWEQQEEELHYVVEANRFLRGMVRALVATQIKVSKQENALHHFRNIILAKDCTKADFSVTGNGLYLEKITYEQGVMQLYMS